MKMSLPLGYFQFTILLSIAGISFLVSGIYLNSSFYQNKIFPNTTINNIDVSGLTINEAQNKLENKKHDIRPHNLILSVDDIIVSSSSADLDSFYSFSEAISVAYSKTHDSSRIKTLVNLIESFYTKRKIVSEIRYEEEKLANLITELNKKVEIIGENPSISLKISGNENSIVVFKGAPGRKINIQNTKEEIRKVTSFEHNNAKDFTDVLVVADVASTSTVLSSDQTELEIFRAKKLVGGKLILKAEDKKYDLNDIALVSFLQPLDRYIDIKLDNLITAWSAEINRDSQSAEFVFNEESLEVIKFKPHKDGLQINASETKARIINWLDEIIKTQNENETENENIIEISLIKTNPGISLEKTNALGINERIGFGESFYEHSIINRVHNVGITAERISLTIVPPGEEFSFNKTLGEVSSKTGFRSAYIISGGKTVLGDGGGVCQVSSTLFRATLDAGLKISKRLQHSYRVSYYELNSDPGFDATVYSGDIDFRFINDTKNHILIYANVDTDNRYMNIEIYGTSDGRSTQISNYKKWDFRGPPAPEYFPSTDLPPGKTEQIDWAVSGIKTEFTHTIRDKFGNTTSENTYYSNYRPWSAKYLRGI